MESNKEKKKNFMSKTRMSLQMEDNVIRTKNQQGNEKSKRYFSLHILFIFLNMHM